MGNRPVFSIITLVYQRMAYMKESLGAMLRQSYPYIEVIIVDNGAIPEVRDYITELERKDGRVKIVHFAQNQYLKHDNAHVIKVCFNGGLKAATGEFIFYQSDDDLIADDYVEKMVALFEGNPACTTAAGAIRSIDEKGRLLDESFPNYRSRYMPGHLLALSTLNKTQSNTMYSAPGCIFAFKRKEFVETGGFHPSIEFSALWGIVPFGITGFDETAVLYWRRHDGQLNKHLNVQGVTAFDVTLDLLKDWQIGKKWEVFGKDVAKFVVGRIVDIMSQSATEWFVISFYHFRYKACWFLFKSLWHRPYFWRHLPFCFWKEKKEFKYYLKPKFRKLFETHPKLVEKFPCLMPLQQRAFK